MNSQEKSVPGNEERKQKAFRESFCNFVLLTVTCNRLFKGPLKEVIQPGLLCHFPLHEFFRKV